MPEIDQEITRRQPILDQAVRDAGALALRFFQSELKSWNKGEDDPVSEADLAVNELLKEQLLGAFPDDGWLSEETEDDRARLQRDLVWIIDPIDGTRAFIKGKPHFSISAALVHQGRPMMACLFNPASDEFFAARAGHGATCNGTLIQTTETTQLAGMATYAHEPMFRTDFWYEPWPELEILMVNSVAYRIALVAKGAADSCITMSAKSDWDLAAALLIAEEAGCICTTRDGTDFQLNRETTSHPSVIVANPTLHAAILRKLEDLRPWEENRKIIEAEQRRQERKKKKGASGG